jgi:hypothetical protein
MRTVIALLLCVPLAGCYVKTYGNQSTSGGTTTTTTSSQVGGSTKFAGGKASFSSGQPVSTSAQGGYVKLSGSAAGVLVVGLVIADLVNYIRGEPQAKPLPPGTAISHTCSCYGYKPPGDEDQGLRIKD